MLGIKPETWRKWKVRAKNAPRFANMLERVRETKLAACIDSINAAGEDKDFEIVTKSGETRTITKPGDWRAKGFMVERILAPERFAQQPSNVTVNQSAVVIQAGGPEAVARMVALYAGQGRQAQVIAPVDQAALTDAKPAIDV